MKSKHRKLYLDAMIEQASRISDGKMFPVVVDSFGFFDAACNKADPPLPHTYGGRDRSYIVRKFGRHLAPCMEELGMALGRVRGELLDAVGHNKEAMLNSEFSADWYKKTAAPARDHSAVAFVVFGVDVMPDHPLFISEIMRYYKPTATRLERVNSKLVAAVDSGRLTSQEVAGLGVPRQVDGLLADNREEGDQ